MRDAGETWDVFVVGQRDRSHASTVMLAAELSHYTGMPTSEVELALMKGEVRVRAGLERSVAESAAMELDDIGAIIDLRLSDGKSGAFPILKPDAMRRSGVAVGGFIDDSATPPEVADNSGLNRLPLEPDAEDLPPPPPMGMPLETLEDIASEPIRIGSSATGFREPSSAEILDAVSGLEREGQAALGHVDQHTGGGRAVVDMPPQRQPDSVPPLMNRASAAPAWINEPPKNPPAGQQPAPQQYAPRTAPAAQHFAPPAPAPQPYAPPPQAPVAPPVAQPYTPPPQASVAPPAAQVEPAASQSGGLMAGLDALEVTELPTAPKTKKKKKKKKRKAPPSDVPPPRTGPDPADSLELDFAAVGMQPKQTKLRDLGGRISTGHQPVDAAPPRRTRAGNMAGTGGAAFGPRGEARGEFILGFDAYTSMPLGAAIGLILSLMVAIQMHRDDEEVFAPLEQELRAATTSEALVEAGEIRPAPKVEAALHETADDLRQSFLMTWLGIGLPIGLALGRIRRND
ncbi:MAG: hypothetical protein AAF721_24705 [Myxococcota bacterium]